MAAKVIKMVRGEERMILADEQVVDRWFNSLLDRGMGIADALDEIRGAYPEHEVPLGTQARWEQFRADQLS
jgi:hypothetical protein